MTMDERTPMSLLTLGLAVTAAVIALAVGLARAQTLGPIGVPRWQPSALYEVRPLDADHSLTFRTVKDTLTGICHLVVVTQDGDVAITNISTTGCP